MSDMRDVLWNRYGPQIAKLKKNGGSGAGDADGGRGGDDSSSLEITQANIKIFREIVKVANEIFSTDESFEPARCVLGKSESQQKKVVKMIIESTFEGVREYSDDFYKLLEVASARQKIIRRFIRTSIDRNILRFSPFDRHLVYQSSKISDLYDAYYIGWLKAVRNSDAAKRILKLQKENIEKLNLLVKKGGLDGQYSIIQLGNDGNFHTQPYAVVFRDLVLPIAQQFEQLVKDLKSAKNLTKEQDNYIEYLDHYKDCLLEENAGNLEKQWRRLDELWMDVKYPIQIVHDIEYHYGDPLRVKVIPDFSLRFLDASYKDENETIEKIHNLMVSYFEGRNHILSRNGLKALKGSYAGIYYLPFQSGQSLHFRFSGQSIPNRPEVKASKGVKIYFDPESTRVRVKRIKELAKKVFNGGDYREIEAGIRPLDIIVYHVSSHEFGHAIYGLSGVKGVHGTRVDGLLEEPRAELTVLFVLKLLFDKKHITKKELATFLKNFAVSDLRRFAMFDSSSLRPYVISALSMYSIYEKTGFITQNDEALSFNDRAISDVLSETSSLFLDILDAEEQENISFLSKTLSSMEKQEKQSKLVRFLISKLFKKN